MTRKKETRTRVEAKKLMWEYYSENKSSLPKWIGEFREEILAAIVSGEHANIVFDELIVFATESTD